MLFGVMLLGLGAAFILVEIYQGGYLPPVLEALTMQPIPRVLRASGLGVAGVVAVIYAFGRLSRELIVPFAPE